jgi:hypothetical protein
MMISRNVTTPPMMACKMDPIPLTIAMRTDPMVRKIDAIYPGNVSGYSLQTLRALHLVNTYTRDYGSHCGDILNVHSDV